MSAAEMCSLASILGFAADPYSIASQLTPATVNSPHTCTCSAMLMVLGAGPLAPSPKPSHVICCTSSFSKTPSLLSRNLYPTMAILTSSSKLLEQLLTEMDAGWLVSSGLLLRHKHLSLSECQKTPKRFATYCYKPYCTFMWLCSVLMQLIWILATHIGIKLSYLTYQGTCEGFLS